MNSVNCSFKFIPTKDGSPSLVPSSSRGEPMHSLWGAFSESLYNYGEALRLGYAHFDSISCAAVGLGLGYNEILWAGYKLKKSSKSTYLESFETVDLLKENFVKWVYDKQSPWADHYDFITSKAREYFNLHPAEFKKALKEAHENKSWVIKGDWNKENTNKKYNVILFDPYSAHTSPELWAEEHLNKKISQFCEETIFATYSSTTKLKQFLKSKNFSLVDRVGFGSKRESTLALRSELIDLNQLTLSERSTERSYDAL